MLYRCTPDTGYLGLLTRPKPKKWHAHMSMDIEHLRKITPSQALGLESLPRPLNLGEMPYAFRNELWSKLGPHFQKQIGDSSFGLWFSDRWEPVWRGLWVKHFQQPGDEFPGSDPYSLLNNVRGLIYEAEYNKVLDFLTALLRETALLRKNSKSQLSQVVSDLLERHKMAYYLDTDGPPTFVPQSTPEEGQRRLKMLCT